MAEYGGKRFGGKKMGGGKYGGNTYGGNKYGASGDEAEPVDSAAEDKAESGPWYKGGLMSKGIAAPKAKAVGTKRATGAGYTGAKGDAGTAPQKSAMYAAAPKKAAAPKAAPKAEKPAYKAKGVPNVNKDLGDFYLNATSNMFSKKAGGNKK